MSDEIPILTEPVEDKAYSFHAKVRKALEDELQKWLNFLEVCDPDRLGGVQGRIVALRWFLKLPDDLREQDKAAEKEKEDGRDRPTPAS